MTVACRPPVPRGRAGMEQSTRLRMVPPDLPGRPDPCLPGGVHIGDAVRFLRFRRPGSLMLDGMKTMKR